VSSGGLPTRRRPDWARRLAVALLGATLGLDLLWALVHGRNSSLSYVVVDWPAHLTTCLLLLMGLAAASRSPRPAVFAAAALVATIAIDVDHIPNYLGWHWLTAGEPRPYPHSLLVVVVLALAGGLCRAPARDALLGAAFGVGAHLARDLATGPGVALLWPLSSAAVRLPYPAFAAGLVLAAALVVFRGTAVPAYTWSRRWGIAQP
jgi:inner membrane protein